MQDEHLVREALVNAIAAKAAALAEMAQNAANNIEDAEADLTTAELQAILNDVAHALSDLDF